MPYGGTTPEQDKKIESCVVDVMKTGKDKVSAIRICKSSILKEKMDKKDLAEEIYSIEMTDDMQFAKGNQINGIEIFKTGTYRNKTYTEKDLDEMVDNFKILKSGDVGFEPPVRIGHRGNDDVKNVLSLAGYIKKLYRKGHSLLSDVEITEPDAYEKIKRGTLRKRSAEIGPYEDNKGNLYKKVIWGFGFVDIPQVEGMAEVKVYSKKEETIDFMKEANEIIELGKGDEKKIQKVMDGLKDLIKKNFDDETGFYDLQNLVSVMSTLKNMRNIADIGGSEFNKKGEKMEEFAKVGDKCKMPDGSMGIMQMNGGKMVCMTGGKEKMTKEGENVELSKEQHADLLAKAEKAEKLQKEMDEVKMGKRMEKVEKFTKEGKSITDSDKEKEFVKTLSDEQFAAYEVIKQEQPKLVELDKEAGQADDKSPEATAKKEKDDAVELAEKLTKPYQKKAE